jgi:hypothetical protein
MISCILFAEKSLELPETSKGASNETAPVLAFKPSPMMWAKLKM